MNLAWSHAVLYVRDMERMLAYYKDVLGFAVTDRGPLGDERSPEIVFLSQDPDEHHQLAMIAVRKAEGPSNSVNHFAFRTDSFDRAEDAVCETEREPGQHSQSVVPRQHAVAVLQRSGKQRHRGVLGHAVARRTAPGQSLGSRAGSSHRTGMGQERIRNSPHVRASRGVLRPPSQSRPGRGRVSADPQDRARNISVVRVPGSPSPRCCVEPVKNRRRSCACDC